MPLKVATSPSTVPRTLPEAVRTTRSPSGAVCAVRLADGTPNRIAVARSRAFVSTMLAFPVLEICKWCTGRD